MCPSAFAVLVTLALYVTSGTCFTFSSKFDPVLTAKFDPRPFGWLGADVSASFQYTNNTYMWLWGDTLYGKINSSNERSILSMPHSSIAYMDMSGSQEPTFYIRPGKTNSSLPDPYGIFTPQNPTNPNEWYWLPIGMMAPSGHLIVVAQTIYPTGTGLGFGQLGTDIIVVKNPLDSPNAWLYTTSRIPSSNSSLSWNSGITWIDGYFYLIGLGSPSPSGHPSYSYLAKILEADLINSNWTGMTYFSQGNVWRDDVSQMQPLYNSTYTEGSLQYHPYMQCWFIVLSQAYEANVYIAYAKEVTGPWTVQEIYTIPEEWQQSPYYTYAGKSHPEFAAENEIVFTFNINSNWQTLESNINIYHPQFVRVSISD